MAGLPPAAIPPLALGRNPFSSAVNLNSINNEPYRNTNGDPTDFEGEIRDPTNPGSPVIDINLKLNTLRRALVDKFNNIQDMGGYGARITNNLQIIRERINKLATLITAMLGGIDQVRFKLEKRMDLTLDNIIQDLQNIQQGGLNTVVAEIGAINAALDEIYAQGAPGQPLAPYANVGGPLEQNLAAWQTAAADAADPVLLPAPPALPAPSEAFMGGGKKKKGGYTYPKMRSRSRLRSHPRITHKFNTIKPKKKIHAETRNTRRLVNLEINYVSYRWKIIDFISPFSMLFSIFKRINTLTFINYIKTLLIYFFPSSLNKFNPYCLSYSNRLQCR